MPTIPILRGLHHVTAVTSNAMENFHFYTRILGMRLVKKTVNQDDVSAYHLFYADELGSPGTELTFFDWSHIPRARQGAGTISEIALRVIGGSDALDFWARWFDQNKVEHGNIERAASPVLPSLPFQDPEGQHLRLVAEPQAGEGANFHPWRKSRVPADKSIVGLNAVNLTVNDVKATARVLTEVLGFKMNPYDASLFELDEGGPGAQLRLLTSATPGIAGAGGVHHVAWRVADVREQGVWLEHLSSHGLATSGLVDRFYFQSVYFRIPGQILFEIATDGPGFTADGEDLEHLGERLSLPPFLETERAQIESGLKPLDSNSASLPQTK